jgi:Gluconate 2-dehydrogenase subunit 3
VNVEPSVAGPQAEPSVVAGPPSDAVPAVLDETQRALLRALLNCVVPERVDLPGAGDLEVGASIERTLATAPNLRRLFLDGLAQVAIASVRASSAAFVDLDRAQQTRVLELVELQSPAFFVALVEHTYRGYYTLPRVVHAIGVQPPQPLGHMLPAFDPALLDRQRQRSQFWRRAT